MKLLFIFLFLINFVVFAQRDPRDKGQANVFWNGTYPLYSLTSDLEIKPNSTGKYEFWGTTNEDPQPKQYSLSKGNTLYVYKFISYEECLKLCNEIRQRNGMQLLNANQQNNSVNMNKDTIFSGQLINSKFGYTGNGEIKYPNGFSYKGGIINSKPDGKKCEIQTARGSKYVGDFKLNDAKISGNGKCFPGDGNGGYNKNRELKGLFIQQEPSGGKLANGTDKAITTTVEDEITVIKKYENEKVVSVTVKMLKTKSNDLFELIIPHLKDDFIMGNYNGVYYEQNKKKWEYEIEVLPSKKAMLKKIVGSDGVIYTAELEFGKVPPSLNECVDFISIKGPFKRLSDGKEYYLDGNFNLTENQSSHQGILSKEQFIQTISKDQNKVYECDCCKKSIQGYKKGITKEGEEWSDFLIEMNPDASPEMVYIMSYKLTLDLAAKAPHLYKNQDLSPIHFMQVNYPYCSKFCYKTCKD